MNLWICVADLTGLRYETQLHSYMPNDLEEV